MPKDTLTIEQLKSLCDYNQKDNCYIAKQGQDYINALAGVVKIINKKIFLLLLLI